MRRAIPLLAALLASAPARASLDADLPSGELAQLIEGLRLHQRLYSPPPAAAPAGNPWSQVRSPSPGPSESIGTPSAGCLRGAQSLAPGADYLIMRPSRGRAFAHPDLLRVLAAGAAQLRAAGTTLIGDLALPRGGPTMTGHVSHQNGLDADVWYWLPPPGTSLSPEDREKLSAPSMVEGDFGGLHPKNWNPRVLDLLQAMASAPETDRILINPAIKKEACRLRAGQDWVGKLRPWWGHDDHFHMRLRCPARDSLCKDQEPVPAGDGCGAALDAWFTEAMRKQDRERRRSPAPPRMPRLPEACAAVLRE